MFSSVTQSCPTLCDPMNRSTPGLTITNSRSLLKLMPIESVMPSSLLILCLPLLLPPSPSSIRVFSNESTLRMRWPKYWSFPSDILILSIKFMSDSSVSRSVLSNSLQPHGLQLAKAPLPMEFSRQEYWRGQPFPSPRDLLTQGSIPGVLHCRHILYCLSHQGSLTQRTLLNYSHAKKIKNPVPYFTFPHPTEVLYLLYYLKPLLKSFNLIVVSAENVTAF